MTTEISLKNLIVSAKEAEVEYPGLPDFKVKIAYLSRETLQKLRKKATSIEYKNRQPVETLNDEKFLALYSKECIRGWSGLKFSYLESLVPVNLGSIDPKTELPYSEDSALDLLKSSTNFDQFISDTITDLGNFATSK